MRHARDDYNRIQDPAGLIPEDEPVFLLRGQDKLAEMTLLYYAQLVKAHGGDPAIIDATIAQSIRMSEWPKKKLPDLAPVAVGSHHVKS